MYIDIVTKLKNELHDLEVWYVLEKEMEEKSEGNPNAPLYQIKQKIKKINKIQNLRKCQCGSNIAWVSCQENTPYCG